MKMYVDINYVAHKISKCKTIFKKRSKTVCGIKIMNDRIIIEDDESKVNKNDTKCRKCFKR